jgi:hypothetical protein
MRRYNIVPLTFLILSIINFALAAPALTPEKRQVRVDVAHVPKDVITVLWKRGDTLKEMEELFANWDRWWGRPARPSSAVRPPRISAPSESSRGSMRVDVPPASPASFVEHPSIPSTVSSDSKHNPPPSLEPNEPPTGPESSIESGHLHTLPSSLESPTGSEHWYTAPSSPVSSPVSGGFPIGMQSTIPNEPRAESLFENFQTTKDELKGTSKGLTSYC